ncbi:MAG: hypothetical protein ACJAUZ_002282, partial [Flavobacteriaceae bacterium]
VRLPSADTVAANVSDNKRLAMNFLYTYLLIPFVCYLRESLGKQSRYQEYNQIKPIIIG